jgi:hypothetical protein
LVKTTPNPRATKNSNGEFVGPPLGAPLVEAAGGDIDVIDGACVVVRAGSDVCGAGSLSTSTEACTRPTNAAIMRFRKAIFFILKGRPSSEASVDKYDNKIM